MNHFALKFGKPNKFNTITSIYQKFTQITNLSEYPEGYHRFAVKKTVQKCIRIQALSDKSSKDLFMTG